ncbi:MAG: hemolysin family protein [Streptosporangiales bacterium]
MTSSDVWLLVLTACLVVVSGLFVATETALSRVSRIAVDEAVREGHRGAPRLQRVVSEPYRYLNLALLLRKLCEITAVVIFTVLMLSLVHGPVVAVVVAAGVMVVVAYIAIGVAPRTLGRQHATAIARAGSPPLFWLARVLGPLPRLLIMVGNALTPGKGFREGPFASEAELRDLVDLAEERRLIEDGERQMIHSVFELGDTLAREVMVPRTEIVFIERDKTLRQTMSLALRSGFSRIPVLGEDEDDVAGVAYLKDVMRRVFDYPETETTERVEQVMRPAYYVPDSKPVDDLLRDMQKRQVHLAVVVDEYGGTAGVVTIEDILEEIVGEITDEYDVEAPPVEQLPDGRVRVTARLSVDDLAEELDTAIDEDGVSTVGGLLAYALGRVPIPGASARIAGLRLTAESATGRRNRIATVLVERLTGPAEGETHTPENVEEHVDA